MVKKLKQIVILGAGFAGIRCAQDLAKKIRPGEAKITLIDQSNVHVFYADLYEVATSFNKKIHGSCMRKLKGSVAVPIPQILKNLKVDFVQDTVKEIDAVKKEVKLGKSKIQYDYLVSCLGSVTNYFDIPGLEEKAFPLKTLDDALRLNCYIDGYFESLWKKGIVRDVYITVGGGGPTGVEFAGELATSIKRICRKYRFPKEKIKIQIVDGSDALACLDAQGSALLVKRLKHLGVEVYMKRYIQKVADSKVFVKLRDGSVEELPADITVWTGGVKVNPLVSKFLGEANKRGCVEVDQYLQSLNYKNVFAAGDNTFCLDAYGRPYPMLAQVAYQQGSLIANNILALIRAEKMKQFDLDHTHYVLPVGGKYAFWQVGTRVFTGIIPWLIRRMVFLKYMFSILPLTQALEQWFLSHKVFVDND